MNLADVFEACSLHVSGYKPVDGGDTSNAYCVQTTQAKYFLKIHSHSNAPGIFKLEAEGLEALRSTRLLHVPMVVRHGRCGIKQYLLLEWLNQGACGAKCWENFGSRLAALHQQPASFFGWHKDNYIGSLPQINTPASSWSVFYATRRLLPLVRSIYDARLFSGRDLKHAEALCNKLDEVFPNEPPALLHGDLWSGNYLITRDGQVAVFDAAVYFGHREIDLAMTRLFRGFPPSFYNAYQQVYPLQTGWEERLQVSQLYPLLVHALLFGGEYVQQAKKCMHRFSG
jgi:fructosamine-3-kinase